MVRWMFFGGCLLALCCACLAPALAAPTEPDPPPSLPGLVGRAAPEFSVGSLDGKVVSLKDYRGKVVLLNFWATWCGNCLVEMPWLSELREKYAAQGFEVLGVLTDDAPPGRLKALLAKDQVKYPILMCNHVTAQAYGGLPYLPMSFFISRDGSIVREAADVTSKADLERSIRSALRSNSQK